jgi:phage tail-like protein
MGTQAVGQLPEFHVGFHFKLDIGSQTVGYFTEISGLQVEYEMFEWMEGGMNDYVHKFRGRAKYANIVLKRGITSSTALLEWFDSVRTGADRRNGSIEMLDQSLGTVARWSFVGALPVKWTGPDFKANANDVAVETLEFAHGGFRTGGG